MPGCGAGGIVGEVTSAACGHRVGAAISRATLDAEVAAPGTALTVDVVGHVRAATVQRSTRLWDSDNARQLAVTGDVRVPERAHA